MAKSCFKIKMQITGKLAGKRGGARIITFVQVIDEEVYLLSIYNGAEQDNNEALEILLKYI